MLTIGLLEQLFSGIEFHVYATVYPLQKQILHINKLLLLVNHVPCNRFTCTMHLELQMNSQDFGVCALAFNIDFFYGRDPAITNILTLQGTS